MTRLAYALALHSGAAACGLLALTACAEGGSIGEGGAGGGLGDGGSEVTNAVSTTGVNSSSASSGGSDEGGEMNTGGAPTTGGGGEGGSPLPPDCDFVAPDDCATAELLPAMAGDEGSPMVTRTGDSSRFFKIHIEEQDSSIGGEDLSYTVSLTSPAGMNYDLKVRQGAQEGPVNCNAGILSGTGTPESVHASWDDDQGFGGEDDAVWLVIEVVYVSGDTCGTGSQWTLQVRGNT